MHRRIVLLRTQEPLAHAWENRSFGPWLWHTCVITGELTHDQVRGSAP